MSERFSCFIVDAHFLFEKFKIYISDRIEYLSRYSSSTILVAVVLFLLILVGIVILIRYLQRRFINSLANVNMQVIFHRY